MNINAVNLLNYLDMLIKHGSFTKAAQSLYVSQSYLTQTIKKIELELRVDIINRKASPLQLTQAGLAYYNHLMQIEAQQETFKQEISQFYTDTKPVIRIGILSNLGTYLLPLFLPQFLKHYPEVRIELHESIPRESEHKLLLGEIDFFIGQNSEVVAPNVVTHNCGMHHYYMVIPQSCPYYQKKRLMVSANDVALKDLLQQPLILTRKGSAIRRQVDYLLDKYSIDPYTILETDNIFTAIELAKNNLGLTIFPENLEIKQGKQAYNLYPLPEDLIAIRYFIAHHATKTLSTCDKQLIRFFINFLNKNTHA